MLSRFRQHQRKVTERGKKDVAKRWQEELSTLSYIASCSELTSWEQRCLRGRLYKRLGKADMSDAERRQLRQDNASLCDGSMVDTICYEITKHLTGFLRHREDIGFLTKI